MNTAPCFGCWYTNADSLINKLVELKLLVDSSKIKPMIIAVTEVKPKNSRFNPELSEYQLDGFEQFHVNLDKKQSRGILIYVNKEISASQVALVSPFEEVVLIEISLVNSDKLLFGCIYRSPNSCDENNVLLIDLMRKINDATHSHKVIVGDFNFPSIDWKLWSNSLVSEEAISNKFLDSMRDGFWIQNVFEPTRGRKGDTPAVLDLVFSNEKGIISDLEIKSPVGKSDHSLLTYTVNSFHKTGKSVKKIIFYDKGDYSKMKECLKLDWITMMDGLTLEEMWELFKNKLKDAEEECIPHRTITSTSNQRMQHTMKLDANSLKRVKKKHKLWKKFVATKSEEDYKQYCRERNYVRSMTRKVQKSFEKEIAISAKKNPKKF